MKSEPVEDYEAQLLALVGKNAEAGVTSDMVLSQLPAFNTQILVQSVNSLMKKKQLQIAKKSNGELLYKLNQTTVSTTLKGADNEEKLIYQLIGDSGNKGIWNKDLHHLSKINITRLNKILKKMETEKLIKRVKSVTHSARKMIYMLSGLTPDKSLTGGAWYGSQGFDVEYAEALAQCCVSILAKKKSTSESGKLDRNFMTSQQILQVIVDHKVSKTELSLKDIEWLLETLVFDGVVERAVGGEEEGSKMYRSKGPSLKGSGVVRVPCGGCPLSRQCHIDGFISPQTCQYMSEWLESIF